MKLDLNQPAEQIVLDQVFRTNGIQLSQDTIDFGTPSALPNAGPWGPDTMVEITAVPDIDCAFTGSVTLQYCRLPLSQAIWDQPTALMLPAVPFQTQDLIPAINAAFGLQLQARDLVNVTYTDYSQPVILNASGASLIYTGSVVLNTQNPVNPELVPSTSLDGFQVAQF